ncbi:MAG: hypothetical protein QF410_02720 [Planctomycetota bacterium]|jgi:hypothetical protein|nr:hypothetical protein [Planctomycetota bacterium]MDP6761965.1 hypothetical protein [Planctomycetota bacterium]
MRRALLLLTLAAALAAGLLVFQRANESLGGGAIEPRGPDAREATAAAGTLREPEEPLPEPEPAPSPAARAAVGPPTLAFRVTSSEGGAMLPEATARVLAAAGGDAAQPRSLSTAEGEATALDVGVWNVTLDAPGHIPHTRIVELEPGDERTLAVTLVRGCKITGTAENRVGEPVSRGRLVFLPEGREFPAFPRDEAGLFIARFDRKGVLEPMLVAPGRYTLCYGSYGRADFRLPCTIQAGADREVLVVSGGDSIVRFELDPLPESNRRIEVVLQKPKESREEDDEDERRRRGRNSPERIARAAAKGKDLTRWETRGRAIIRDGVGSVRRARPGTYRLALLARPGEYIAEEEFEVGSDESIVVRIATPVLPARSGARRNDPKTPQEGPLQVTIEREGSPSERPSPGIFWR